MEGIRFIDIYATKGIEYLIVISFLAAFVLFCRYMYRPREEGTAAKVAPSSVTRFRVPEGLFYHQGHGWLRPEPGSVGVVGLDDFAQKLIGKIDAVELPPVGSRLAQGDRGWSLVVDAVPIPMLSPVAGEVVEVNPEVLRSPEILREDPYGTISIRSGTKAWGRSCRTAVSRWKGSRGSSAARSGRIWRRGTC
ncbi:MAG: glycine cleavage H-protein [Deltaproteobacteria bacterium]|nr:glycine cleavage H-protein [Deltaproteobacteria bacterium]